MGVPPPPLLVTSTLPADLSGFADGTGYDSAFVVRGLPSIISTSGDQPTTLFLSYNWSDRHRKELNAFLQNGMTPGIDFGAHGEGYLRFSYANSIENIDEGMSRIAKFLS